MNIPNVPAALLTWLEDRALSEVHMLKGRARLLAQSQPLRDDPERIVRRLRTLRLIGHNLERALCALTLLEVLRQGDEAAINGK